MLKTDFIVEKPLIFEMILEIDSADKRLNFSQGGIRRMPNLYFGNVLGAIQYGILLSEISINAKSNDTVMSGIFMYSAGKKKATLNQIVDLLFVAFNCEQKQSVLIDAIVILQTGKKGFLDYIKIEPIEDHLDISTSDVKVPSICLDSQYNIPSKEVIKNALLKVLKGEKNA